MSAGDPIVRWLAAFALLAPIAYFARCSGTAKNSRRMKSHWLRLRRSLLASPGILRHRESIRLTPQHSMHLIEFESRRLLVACHPGGATLISPGLAELTQGRSEADENSSIAC